jgi:hypothetical protein
MRLFTNHSNERKGTKNYGLGIRMINLEWINFIFTMDGGMKHLSIHYTSKKGALIIMSNKFTAKLMMFWKDASLFGKLSFRIKDE